MPRPALQANSKFFQPPRRAATDLPTSLTAPLDAQAKTSVSAPAPARERKAKQKAAPVPAEKLAEKLKTVADAQQDDAPSASTAPSSKADAADAAAPKRRGRPPGSKNASGAGKENAKVASKEAKKAAAAKAAKAASKKPASGKGSRKATAMGKAAAVAAGALKRTAAQFAVDEDPSSHGSVHKHAGGRPAKRQAKAVLYSRFDAAATPDSPDVLANVGRVADRWPEDSPSPLLALPAAAAARKPGRPAKSNLGASAGGRYGAMAAAAVAAADAAKNAVGSRGEKLPAGRAEGAWSSAYRTLQAAHIKLQTKYEKLKETKLQGLIDEADSYRLELADHGQKAEELINHFRGEATRQREAAAGAEDAGARVYELERENSELKESVLAYQGKILRVEQEAAATTQRLVEEARASGSGRWGSEELEAFTGLRWEKQTTGVHRFTHVLTGFTFQLSASDVVEDADEEANERRRRESDVMRGAAAPAEEVAFTPLAFGAADGYLPGYLSEAIEFERGEMPEFIGRMLGVLNQVAAEHVAPRA